MHTTPLTATPAFEGDYMLADDVQQQTVRLNGEGLTVDRYKQLSARGWGVFWMFIDARTISGEVELVTGRIFDNQNEGRWATFDGRLWRDSFCFVKRYPITERMPSSLLEEIPYTGRQTPDGTFQGTYLMKVGLGNRVEWRGQFVLKRYVDPRQN